MVSYIWRVPGSGDTIGHGNSGFVVRFGDDLVYKHVFTLDKNDFLYQMSADSIRNEQDLGSNGLKKGIISLVNRDDDGLYLPYMAVGNLGIYLKVHPPSLTLRVDWCLQVAKAIQFARSKGVIHCDIDPTNVLVTDDLNIVLRDFGGSWHAAKGGYIAEGARYFRPRNCKDEPISQNDLFALVSLVYFITSSSEMFESLKDADVEGLFSRKDLPNVDHLVTGTVISGCWTGVYDDAVAVV